MESQWKVNGKLKGCNSPVHISMVMGMVIKGSAFTALAIARTPARHDTAQGARARVIATNDQRSLVQNASNEASGASANNQTPLRARTAHGANI